MHLSNAGFAEGDDGGSAEGKAPLTAAAQIDHHDRLISTAQLFAKESGRSLLSHRCFDRVVVLGSNESPELRSRGRAAAADTFGKSTGTAWNTACTPLQEATVGAATGGGGTLTGSSSSGGGSSRSGAASRNTSGSGIAGEGSNDAVAPIGTRFTSGAGTARRDNIDPSPNSVDDERHGGCVDEEKAGLLKEVDIGEVHDGREGVQFREGRRQNNWDGKIGTDARGVSVLSDEGGGGGIESGGDAFERNGGGEENDNGEGPVEEEERKEGSVDARVSGHVGLFLYFVFRYCMSTVVGLFLFVLTCSFFVWLLWLLWSLVLLGSRPRITGLLRASRYAFSYRSGHNCCKSTRTPNLALAGCNSIKKLTRTTVRTQPHPPPL